VLTLTISVAFNLRRERARILRLGGERSYIGAKLWLEGLLGFEPRVVELTVTMDYVAYLRGVRAVPRLYVIPWHLPDNGGNSRKTSVKVSEIMAVILHLPC